MKTFIFFALGVFLFACGGNPKETESDADVDSTPKTDEQEDIHNDGFRNVSVEKIGENEYQVTGEARVFEANVEWVVEDGHRELKKGFTTAEAGAPEWGAFSFTVQVEKDRPNSTLLLILFQTNARDGSRLHEFFVALPTDSLTSENL